MQVSIKVNNTYLIQCNEDLEEVRVTDILKSKNENFICLSYVNKPLVRKMRASEFVKAVQLKTGYYKKIKFLWFFEREVFVKAKLNDVFVNT